MNDYCGKNKIPLVHGATNGYKGQVAVYIPGETPCLKCQGAIIETDRERRNSCQMSPIPNVITTTTVISGIMTDEVTKILMGKKDKCLKSVLKYDANNPKRFAFFSEVECHCFDY